MAVGSIYVFPSAGSVPLAEKVLLRGTARAVLHRAPADIRHFCRGASPKAAEMAPFPSSVLRQLCLLAVHLLPP